MTDKTAKTSKTPKLSLVMPAYNESERITRTLKAYTKQLDGTDYEIIVVINNTTDDTLDRVKKEATKNSKIKYIDIPVPINKGGACVYGMHKAEGDIIGYIDADLSTSPKQILKMAEILEASELGYIIASRALPDSLVKNKSFSRLFISKGYNIGVNTLFRLGIEDTQCGAKLFQKKAIKKVLSKIKTSNMAFDVDLLFHLKKNKFKFLEYPVTWVDEPGSSIGSPLKTSLSMCLSTVEMRLDNSFARGVYGIYRPLFGVIARVLHGKSSSEWRKVDVARIGREVGESNL